MSHFLGMPTTRIAKRFDGRSDLAFVKFIPSSNLTTDTSGPVLIANGSGNIEAIAQAKDVGDLVNSEPRVAGKKSAHESGVDLWGEGLRKVDSVNPAEFKYLPHLINRVLAPRWVLRGSIPILPELTNGRMIVRGECG